VKEVVVLAVFLLSSSGQVTHCKPTGVMVICHTDSPFDPPEVIAERTRQECVSALVAEDRIIHQLAAIKSRRGTVAVSKEVRALRDRHRDLSHKIEILCWK